MSADDWSVCPRCLAREETHIADLQARARAGYGTLPLAEFEGLRAEASKPLDPEQFRTFREDYEFYGAEEGRVTATYSGHCTKCGLGLDFTHTEPIPEVDAL